MKKDYELNLVYDFIRVNMPKKRRKLNPQKKHFKKTVIIPLTLNDGTEYVYYTSDKHNIEIIFTLIFEIIKDVFPTIDTNILNEAIYRYLGIF